MKTALKSAVILVLVALCALPLNAAGKTFKRKVILEQFENKSKYAKGMLYDRKNDPMGDQALKMLSEKLNKSGSFIVMEKAATGEVIPDLIMTGTINQFGRKAEGKEKILPGKGPKTVAADISVKVDDGANKALICHEQALGSAETESKATMAFVGKKEYDEKLSEGAFNVTLNVLIEKLKAKAAKLPWRTYFHKKDGMNYIVRGGALQGMAVGDVLAVYDNSSNQVSVKKGTLTVKSLSGNTLQTEMAVCTYDGMKLDSDLSKYVILEK